MDAKRHFQDVYGNTYNTPFDSISMVKFAEAYHLAKSKEEAEERLSRAMKAIPRHLGTLDKMEVKEAIRIASGKEEI